MQITAKFDILIVKKFSKKIEREIAIKKLKLIYNDHAGNRGFKHDLDPILKIFSTAGYDINILRTENPRDIAKHLSRPEARHYDTIVSAGGDGTLNLVISAALQNRLPAQIGIIPAGTANDFARFLHLSSNIEAAQVIAGGRTKKIDVGTVNDRYFINVFGCGLLTNISNHVDPALKNTLGNMAYYLKGLEKLNSVTPMPITIKNSQTILQEEIYFLLALNTSGAGGFDRIVDTASVSDGHFDVIAVRSSKITDMMGLIVKFLRHEHISDDRIIYFRDNNTEIYGPPDFETNIDGEKGVPLPVKLGMLPKALEVFIP